MKLRTRFCFQVKTALEEMTPSQKQNYLQPFISNYLFFVVSPSPYLPRGFFSDMTGTKTRADSFQHVLQSSNRFLCSVVNLFREFSLIGWRHCYRSWARLFWNLQELLPQALVNGTCHLASHLASIFSSHWLEKDHIETKGMNLNFPNRFFLVEDEETVNIHAYLLFLLGEAFTGVLGCSKVLLLSLPEKFVEFSGRFCVGREIRFCVSLCEILRFLS